MPCLECVDVFGHELGNHQGGVGEGALVLPVPAQGREQVAQRAGEVGPGGFDHVLGFLDDWFAGDP